MAYKEDLRIVRTRKLLSNTLLSMMEDESIEKISVIDLCQKAMVNRATFYAHFEDKYHLLSYSLEELKDELYEQFTKDSKATCPNDTLRLLVSMAVEFFYEEKGHVSRILINNRNGKVISTVQDSIAQSLRYQFSKYKENYEIKIPIHILASFIAGGLINSALYCLDNPEKHTKEDLLAYANLVNIDHYFVKR
ncbi:MAG: hypothetical protein IK048_04535 [Clostridia bacterium]|nr:hypothetical protein [Clostridia bacterium]